MSTDTDLSALRALASRATPGPWAARSIDWRSIVEPTGLCVAEARERLDSDFIAAANPATVLALLDRLEAAERAMRDCSLVLCEKHAIGYRASEGCARCQRDQALADLAALRKHHQECHDREDKP